MLNAFLLRNMEQFQKIFLLHLDLHFFSLITEEALS